MLVVVKVLAGRPQAQVGVVVLARPGQLPVRAREQRVGPRAAPQVQRDGTIRTFLEKKRSNQKSPLTVQMVTALENFTADEENLARDRVAASCFLLCIYLRARCSDMLALSGIRADEVHMDGIVEGYLEAIASRSKSSYTLERKTTLLPMAGPRRGVSSCNWFKHWQFEPGRRRPRPP